VSINHKGPLKVNPNVQPQTIHHGRFLHLLQRGHWEYVSRTNTKGVFLERWVHSGGCRKWFNALRNTATDEVLAVYEQGAEPPAVDASGQSLATPSGEPVIGSGNDATKVVRSHEESGRNA